MKLILPTQTSVTWFQTEVCLYNSLRHKHTESQGRHMYKNKEIATYNISTSYSLNNGIWASRV